MNYAILSDVDVRLAYQFLQHDASNANEAQYNLIIRIFRRKITTQLTFIFSV